jgi:hypothetical protein
MSIEKQLKERLLVGILKAGKDLMQWSRKLSSEIFGIILWLVYFGLVVYKQKGTKGNIPNGCSGSNDCFENDS